MNLLQEKKKEKNARDEIDRTARHGSVNQRCCDAGGYTGA
jgi:hypothetical protein